MLRKILILFGIIFFLMSCAILRLEKKLVPDIAEWYNLHEILMRTRVPKWIVEEGMTERGLFLRLPESMQRKYVRVFWNIRFEETKDAYYERIKVANRFFAGEGKDGYQTDRGRVLLLCGTPFNISHIHDRSNSGRVSVQGYRYEIWNYLYRGRQVTFVFEHDYGIWKRSYRGVGNMSEAVKFELLCQKLFAPTDHGWDLLGGWLLDWLRNSPDGLLKKYSFVIPNRK